jgi:hypothetical protein
MNTGENVFDATGYGQYIANLRDLLKMTRHATSLESDRVVHQAKGQLRLTQKADTALSTLVKKLASNIGFEHLSKNDLMHLLTEFVGEDQRAHVGNPSQAAKRFILENGRSPEHATFYFGVRHLSGLEHPLDLGFAMLLPRETCEFLRVAIGDAVFEECAIYCRVTSEGGTTDKLVERAKRSALSALSLLRLQLRQADRAVVSEQLLFDLHPVYAREIDGSHYWGFRAEFQPEPFSLQGLTAPSLAPLEKQGQELSRLPAPFKERVETALEWLNVAAGSATWQTKLLTIFGAMESLLVPEVGGNKAEVVTVRAAIIEGVNNDGYFTSPEQTLDAYLLRCDLTHGSPTGHGPVTVEYEGLRVEIDDPDDLADRCYWWAMDVLTAWEQYATAYLDRGGAPRPKALVADLDSSGAAAKVCKWFTDHGADSLVEKYKVSAGLGNPPA